MTELRRRVVHLLPPGRAPQADRAVASLFGQALLVALELRNGAAKNVATNDRLALGEADSQCKNKVVFMASRRDGGRGDCACSSLVAAGAGGLPGVGPGGCVGWGGVCRLCAVG